MNLPMMLSERIIQQINENGDERIDHDEFVRFFLKLLMGSLEEKMRIAFKCYDLNDVDSLNENDVSIILKNVPLTDVERYGETIASFNNQTLHNRAEYSK